MNQPSPRQLTSLVWFFVFAPFNWAATDTVVILHTNDIHDHVLAGYNGVGGMPYISSYIKSVKAKRDDVFVLDAGDVAEKGDMIAFMDQSRITYKAMAMIGYRLTTGLEPDRYYEVVMPEMEWTDRFQKAFEKARREDDAMALPPEREIHAEAASFSFTDAVAGYIRQRNFDQENSLLDHIHSVVAAQTSGDWDLRMAIPAEYRYLVPAAKK